MENEIFKWHLISIIMMFNFVECWGDAHEFIELIEGSLNTYTSIKIPIPHKDSRVDIFPMKTKTEKVRGRKWAPFNTTWRMKQ